MCGKLSTGRHLCLVASAEHFRLSRFTQSCVSLRSISLGAAAIAGCLAESRGSLSQRPSRECD